MPAGAVNESGLTDLIYVVAILYDMNKSTNIYLKRLIPIKEKCFLKRYIKTGMINLGYFFCESIGCKVMDKIIK